VDRGLLSAAAGELLPSDDFNTRLVVYGRDAAQARTLAEAVARAARDNVAYFAGTFAELQAALQTPTARAVD
jgi:hypothetical protein